MRILSATATAGVVDGLHVYISALHAARHRVARKSVIKNVFPSFRNTTLKVNARANLSKVIVGSS